MQHDPFPDRIRPRQDIVAMLARLQIPVLDPDLHGRCVLAKLSDRCHLRIDDERQPDPRDREHAGLRLVFVAVDLPDTERHAYGLELGEALRFAGTPARLPSGLPSLKATEKLLGRLAAPLVERFRQFDPAHPAALLAALVENRFGSSGSSPGR